MVILEEGEERIGLETVKVLYLDYICICEKSINWSTLDLCLHLTSANV